MLILRVKHLPRVEVWKVIYDFLQCILFYKKVWILPPPIHPMGRKTDKIVSSKMPIFCISAA
jgi:hypothetical protein